MHRPNPRVLSSSEDVRRPPPNSDILYHRRLAHYSLSPSATVTTLRVRSAIDLHALRYCSVSSDASRVHVLFASRIIPRILLLDESSSHSALTQFRVSLSHLILFLIRVLACHLFFCSVSVPLAAARLGIPSRAGLSRPAYIVLTRTLYISSRSTPGTKASMSLPKSAVPKKSLVRRALSHHST